MSKIKSFFIGNPLARAREKLEDEQRVLAHRSAEMHYADAMRNFYNRQVSTVDPHKDWWRFADMKQKHQEQFEHYTRCADRVAESEARVAALQNEVSKLENPDA